MKLPVIPASFFGIALGLFGLGNSWRAAAALWKLPPLVGESIMLGAIVVCTVLLFLYGAKWVLALQSAKAEARDPIQCCYVGLAPACLALMAIAIAPYSRALADAGWIVGSVAQLLFGVYRSGGMWRGGRDVATVTPVMFLPTVAGNFICATAAGTLGQTSWGLLLFGAGFFNWVVMESVILFRLWMAPSINAPLRPTIGIHLAPAAVGATAYLSNTAGVPDVFAQIMWGYAVFQVLMVLRLLPWIAQQQFVAGYWGFSFGITALATSAIRMTLRGAVGAIPLLATGSFLLANVLLFGLAVGTLWRMSRGELLPSPTTADAGTRGAAIPN